MFGFWQLGYMTPSQYMIKHNVFAAAMKKADPSIALVASGAFPASLTIHSEPFYSAAAALGRAGTPNFRELTGRKPGYGAAAVRLLLNSIKVAASEGPAEVLLRIADTRLPIYSRSVSAERYDPQEVDDYLTRLRQAMADAAR